MPLLSDAICLDKGFAKLSPPAAVLFLLVLPRLNAYGKMDGDHYAVKGLCCRYVDYIKVEDIPGLLRECSCHTSLKYWEDSEGHPWVHSVNYEAHNPGLKLNRRGKDKLPSWPNQKGKHSGTNPGLVRDYSDPEGEGEGEGEGEYKASILDSPSTTSKPDATSAEPHPKDSPLTSQERGQNEKDDDDLVPLGTHLKTRGRGGGLRPLGDTAGTAKPQRWQIEARAKAALLVPLGVTSAQIGQALSAGITARSIEEQIDTWKKRTNGDGKNHVGLLVTMLQDAAHRDAKRARGHPA